MTYLILSCIFITVTALICFSFVWIHWNKRKISTRAMYLLCGFGSVSWVIQMFLLWSLSNNAAEGAFVVTVIAMLCCMMLLYGYTQATFSVSATAQALLWGIFVFPGVLLVVLLLDLLPEGSKTLFIALGLS